MEDLSCGYEKDVNRFQKGIIIGLHQANKTTKDMAETTKIGAGGFYLESDKRQVRGRQAQQQELMSRNKTLDSLTWKAKNNLALRSREA